MTAEWPTQCEFEFESMSRAAPSRLIAWIRSGVLAPADLTFAAECLGDADHPEVPRVLIELTRHTAAVVREGAVYGIGRMSGHDRDTDALLQRLHEMAYHDPSPGVKSAARDVLMDCEP